MTAKQYRVQAMAGGCLLSDVTVSGKVAYRLAQSEALRAIYDRGRGFMRRQTIGARSWAVFGYTGGTYAFALHGDEAAQACESFEALSEGAAQ